MNIGSTRPKLPPLPQPPNNGKGRLEAEIKHQAPVTVETRLGSIPADYETYSGWEKRESIYFHSDHKEASNPHGRSKAIWRAQPTYTPEGKPALHEVTTKIVAAPLSPVTNTLKFGALGGLLGAGLGAIAGGLLFGDIGKGAAIGAAAGAGIGGFKGHSDAAADRVKLEWQETPITDKELVGYIHDVEEDEDYVCYGYGEDRDCYWETDDYEHTFEPIIEKTSVGTYFKPVVVHYREDA